MNTWLLVVVTTLFAHGSNDPSVITFQEFNTKIRCEQVAKWINTTYGRESKAGTNTVYAQCIQKD